MSSYATLQLDAAGVVRASSVANHETDELAMTTAAMQLLPGQAGEVWQSSRLVGHVRGAK
jgi:hypothetical protein